MCRFNNRIFITLKKKILPAAGRISSISYTCLFFDRAGFLASAAFAGSAGATFRFAFGFFAAGGFALFGLVTTTGFALFALVTTTGFALFALVAGGFAVFGIGASFGGRFVGRFICGFVRGDHGAAGNGFSLSEQNGTGQNQSQGHHG
jgi:hypothetical protein